MQTSLANTGLHLIVKKDISIMKWGRDEEKTPLTDFREQALKSLMQELLRTLLCAHMFVYLCEWLSVNVNYCKSSLFVWHKAEYVTVLYR